MAEITGGELKYIATIDTSQLDKSLLDSQGKLKGFSEIAENTGEQLDNALKGNIIENLKKIGLQSELTGKELKDAIKGAEDFVGGMELGLKEAIRLNEQLAKEISSIPDGANRDEMIKEWKSLNTEIEDSAIAIELLRNHVADVKFESAPLQTQFSRAKEEMEQLVLLGEKGSPKYRELSDQAAKLKNAMGEVASELKIVSDPSGMQGFISILTTLSGAVSTAAGVYGLFGKESEKIEAITDKINAVMAVAVGLQGVASQGLQAYNAVTNMFSVTQGRLAVALGISNVAAKALLGTFSLGLAIVIPIVANYISNLIEKQKESTRSQQELSKAIKDSSGATAKEIGELNRLYSTATNVNTSIRERLSAVDQLKKSYPGHFGLINQEIILNGKAEASYLAVRDAILKAAKARAAQSVLDKRTEGLLNNQEDAKTEIAKLMSQNRQLESFLRSGKKTQTMGIGVSVLGIEIQQDFTPEMAKKVIEKNKKNISDIAKNVTKDVEQYNNNNKRLTKIIEEGNSAMFDATFKEPDAKKTKITSPTTTKPSNPSDNEEIFLVGSLADLRKKLSEVEEAFNKTNSEITRDTLNQQKIALEAQIKSIEDRYKINAKSQTDEEKAFEKFLQAHQTFEQQKTAITEKFDKIRASIDASDLSEDEKTRLKTEAAEEQGKEISEAFLKGLRDNPDWVEAFGKIETFTIEKLKKLRASLVNQLSKMQSNGAAASDIKAVQDQIQKMDGLINKTSNPFELIRKGIKAIGDESLSTEQKLEAYNNSLAAFKGVTNSAKEIVSGLEDVFTSLGGNMDSTFGDIMSNVQQTISGLEQFGEGATQALSGFASGNMLQAAAGTIKAIGGAIKAVSGWFNGDKKKEREIKKQAAALKELEAAYTNLGRTIDKALGEKVFDASKAAISNLKQQKAVLEQMMRTEGNKKKADQDKINGYKDQISSINNTIEDMQQSMVDKVLNGVNAKGLADQLADALTNAFQTGEDSAEAMGKTFDKILADMVKNALKMKLLEGPMQAVVDKMLASMGYSVGANGITGTFDGLTDAEREELKNMMNQAGTNYMDALGAYTDLFGSQAENAQGLKGDIKGITEKTAGALESQVNAIRTYQVEALNVHRANQLAFVQMLQNLVMIEFNTRRLHSIDENIKEMNSKMAKGLAGIG